MNTLMDDLEKIFIEQGSSVEMNFITGINELINSWIYFVTQLINFILSPILDTRLVEHRCCNRYSNFYNSSEIWPKKYSIGEQHISYTGNTATVFHISNATDVIRLDFSRKVPQWYRSWNSIRYQSCFAHRNLADSFTRSLWNGIFTSVSTKVFLS